MPNGGGGRSEFRQCASLTISMMSGVRLSVPIDETHRRHFSIRISRLLNVCGYIGATAHEAHATEGVTDD
jgi:hypothetical protein